MSRSKLRDQLNGVQPKNVPVKREELPQSPAKKPYSGYCKRLKGEHVYELDNVKSYRHHSYPQGYPGPLFVTGVTDRKEYRCTGCGKKKEEYVKMEFDVPYEEKRAS